MRTVELIRYRTEDDREPFSEWLNGLKDVSAQVRVRARLRQLEGGNLGDCRAVGDGVMELRIHLRPGYRVYFGRQGPLIILLLSGGNKKTQVADIGRAKLYWQNWKGLQL
jgi:putative addiction module killer protein